MGNQAEGKLKAKPHDGCDSEEDKQVYYGENNRCHEQIWSDEFDEEDLFNDYQRNKPCDDEEAFAHMSVHRQQHVDKPDEGKSIEHHGGDVFVAGMEIKHLNPPSRIQ